MSMLNSCLSAEGATARLQLIAGKVTAAVPSI
jgi:hypothetical protein